MQNQQPDENDSPEGKPFERECAHCGEQFWVELKFQTDIGPDSPWNVCPKCVKKIADGTCSDDTFRSLGF